MNNKHLNYLFDSLCCASVLPVFDNLNKTSRLHKEISESVACLHAARTYSGVDTKDENVDCYVVGDGIRPRTGILLAYFTLWDVKSIDPLMDLEWWEKFVTFKTAEGFPPRRIKPLKGMIEDFDFPANPDRKSIIVLPHSHASMYATLNIIGGESAVVALPCCTPIPEKLRTEQFVVGGNYINYLDLDVISPKREIHVWKSLSYEKIA